MEFIKSFSATMMTNKQTNNNNNKNRTKIKSMMETVIIINERYVLIVENKTKKMKSKKKTHLRNESNFDEFQDTFTDKSLTNLFCMRSSKFNCRIRYILRISELMEIGFSKLKIPIEPF